MHEDERKIGMLIAAFADQRQQLQVTLDAMGQTRAQLQTAVAGAAHDAVAEALVTVKAQAESAAATMRQVERFHVWRAAVLHFTTALGAIAVTLVAVWWYVPTVSEMNQLRAERDELQASIEDLTHRGGKMKTSGCGPKSRRCVLVDAAAGRFGFPGHQDDVYMIVKGY